MKPSDVKLKNKTHNLTIDEILKYQYRPNPDRPFENLAIAKIQFEMLNMEIQLISEMVNSNKLQQDKMLIIDGSLQFSSVKEEDKHIFRNVIGISKTFNPHLQDILKTKRKKLDIIWQTLNLENVQLYINMNQNVDERKKLKLAHGI